MKQTVSESLPAESAPGKALTEMTPAELWALFPIFLVPPDDRWEDHYREMETMLRRLLSDFPVDRISQIGSTAVKTIWAKNIIDVLVELPEAGWMEDAACRLERNGFLRMSDDGTRISLNRGYTPSGFADKVYHIHLRCTGDHDELYFRDYLREFPEVARVYETLKLRLWEQYPHDRDAYTAAKTEFVQQWTRAAKEKYGSRY